MPDKLDLRSMLNMDPQPEFLVELPVGWSRRDVSDETFRDFEASMKRNLMQAHQPQTYAVLGPALRDSFDKMRNSGAFAFFAPIDAPAESPRMAASIIARYRRSEDGQPLDGLVRSLIRERGAQPLLDDPRTLRYEDAVEVRLGEGRFVNHSITYLTPVPGSRRLKALELVASLVRPAGLPKGSERLRAQKDLLDLIVASVRWVKPN
ncbi:hypothetical protein ABT304_24535 [Nocardioides sp. NPDC000445]|uniref:hypothetical protein n=1 Tax=Nocardioides sp. NPDC000445 TaxID=3154257 RepID=UPI00331A2A5B